MKISFYPQPNEKKLRSVSAFGLYYAIDLLIVTCPPDMNPMTAGGFNFWSWGILKIGNKEIPAPFKDYGIDAMGREIDLSDQQSAITNTYIFLERLYQFHTANEQGKDLKQAFDFVSLPLLYEGLNVIKKIGNDGFLSILDELRVQCLSDIKMTQMIN